MSELNFQVHRRPLLVEEVTTQLRDMIISGDLPPGKQLLQTELSKKFGVSRTPLREAFRILEKDGLVRISNGNRTIEVLEVTGEDLEEMYQIREVLDGLAARLAAEHGISDEERDELLRLLGELESTADPYDPARRSELHVRFHVMIFESSGNSRLQSSVELVRMSTAALFTPGVSQPDRASIDVDGVRITHGQAMAIAHEQHREIVEAILARDGRRAEAAARRHTRRTLQGVRRLREWSEREKLAAAQ